MFFLANIGNSKCTFTLLTTFEPKTESYRNEWIRSASPNKHSKKQTG